MNPSTALATVLVDELVRNQVTDVVLAPGSRNAPLSIALHAADTAGRLRLHVRIDERTAAFLALGLARHSGRPTPVVTTSGTATVNLHPAVVEAHHSGIPLVAITANRPAELQGVGANQTIDQADLFGRSVRAAVTMPAGETRVGQHAGWRATVCRLLAVARGDLTGDPGPVQLDVAFREPLLPDGVDDWPEPLAGRPHGQPWVELHGSRTPPDQHGRPGDPSLVARTLVLLGSAQPATATAAAALADRHGWPLVTEPVTLAGYAPPTVEAGGLLLGAREWVDTHRPDRVLLVGRATLSRATNALLSRSDVEVVVVGEDDRWPDAPRTARHVVDPGWLRRAAHRDPVGDPAFRQDWQKAGAAVRAAVDALLDDEPTLTGQLVAREVFTALPDDALLVLGSSNAVRDVVTGAPVRSGIRLLANRGAAGIDGTVSTAVGAALDANRTHGPAYALMGDLTFLHDSTGLVIGPHEPRPDLTIVVNNDDGGGIFSVLEQGAPGHAAAFERVFGTPHGTDLAALCAATGTPYTLAGSVAELRTALAPQPGLRVVEVRSNRSSRRDLEQRLRATVRAALG